MLLCLVTVTIGHWYYSDSLLIIVAKLLGCFRHSTGRMLSQCRVLFSNLVAFFTVSVLKIFCNLEIYIEWLELWFISLLNLQRQKGKRKLQFELAQIPVHFNIFLGPTSIILIVLKVSVFGFVKVYTHLESLVRKSPKLFWTTKDKNRVLRTEQSKQQNLSRYLSNEWIKWMQPMQSNDRWVRKNSNYLVKEGCLTLAGSWKKEYKWPICI